jgi:hypothetical protein
MSSMTSSQIATAIKKENEILNNIKSSYLTTKFRRIKLKGIEKGLSVKTAYAEESSKSYSSFWAIRNAKNRCATKYNAGSPMPCYAIVHQGDNQFKYYIFDSLPENMNTNGDYSTVDITKTGLSLTVPGFNGQSGNITLEKDSIALPNHYIIGSGNTVTCKKTSVRDIPDDALMNIERKKKCNKIKDSIVRDESRAKDAKLIRGVNSRIGFTPMNATSLYEGYVGYEGATNMKSKLADISSYRYSQSNRNNPQYYTVAGSKLKDMKKHYNKTQSSIKDISKYNKQVAKFLRKKLNKRTSTAKTVNNHNLERIKRRQKTYKRTSRNYGNNERNHKRRISNYKKSKKRNKSRLKSCRAWSQTKYWKNVCGKKTRSCKYKWKGFRRRRSCRWRRKCKNTRKTRLNRSKYNRCKRTYNNRISSGNNTIRRETNKRNADALIKRRYASMSDKARVQVKRFKRNPSTRVDGKKYYLRKEMSGFGNMNNGSQEGFTSTSNMNCNNDGIYTQNNFDSSPHHLITKRATEVNALKHTLTDAIPNPLSGSIFNTDIVGDCRNATGVTDQEMTINYTINHRLENITIVKIKNGKITYKIAGNDTDTYTFIMSDGDAKMTLDNNGNLKLGTKELCNNGNIIPYNPDPIFKTDTLSQLNANQTIEGGKYKFKLGSSFNTNKLTYASINSKGNKGTHGHKYTEKSHITGSGANTNIFVIYKLNTYNLPPTQKFLLEGRLYSIVKKATPKDCTPNTCFVREIKESIVTHNNLNETYIEMNNSDLTGLTIQGIFNGNGGKNIHDINTAITPELKRQVGVIDNIGLETFTPYSNEGFGTMFVEGFDKTSFNKDIDHIEDVMNTFSDDRDKLKKNITDISLNWHYIDNSGGTINDDYEAHNNLIPFVFDACGNSTDFYKTDVFDNSGNVVKDRRAKIDAIEEDLDEMLRQQNTLYTLGSLTAATFLVTAILLARN